MLTFEAKVVYFTIDLPFNPSYLAMLATYKERKNKTANGRKDRTQKKAKKDLDKWCDGLVWPQLCEMC